MAQRPKESDVRRRTGLTAGLLAPARGGATGASGTGAGAETTQSSEEYLQQTEDELNSRVDGSVVALADGFLDLMKLASVRRMQSERSQKHPFINAYV